MIDLSDNTGPEVHLPDEYDKPPDDCIKECESLCEGRSINDIRKLADYFNKVADTMNQIAKEDMTMEDFEKAKKDTSTEIPTIDSINEKENE